MKHLLLTLLFLGVGGHRIAWGLQDDFLTAQEVDRVRDTQEPGKRVELYLEFAQLRLDWVKADLASEKANVGKLVQGKLRQYIAILEALEGTILDGREQRAPLKDALEKLTEQGSEFLRYLESLESISSPGYEDYRFTLAEAIAMTQDELAEAEQGPFP